MQNDKETDLSISPLAHLFRGDGRRGTNVCAIVGMGGSRRARGGGRVAGETRDVEVSLGPRCWVWGRRKTKGRGVVGVVLVVRTARRSIIDLCGRLCSFDTASNLDSTQHFEEVGNLVVVERSEGTHRGVLR